MSNQIMMDKIIAFIAQSYASSLLEVQQLYKATGSLDKVIYAVERQKYEPRLDLLDIVKEIQ